MGENKMGGNAASRNRPRTNRVSTDSIRTSTGTGVGTSVVFDIDVAVTDKPQVDLATHPITVICPNCHRKVRTRTTEDVPCIAHCFCILCCVFCCWLCSCIPYFMMRQTHHNCPKCGAYLGCSKKG